MTDTEFAGSLRAAEAFRGGLQRQAERPIFRPLDVADLTDRGRPPRLGPWLAAAVAMVVIVAAGGFILPRLGDPSVPAAPVATPTVTPRAYGQWTKIAPSPLSPRWEALGVWADGRYLILGGHSDFMCGPAARCVSPTWLNDGALYDPVTDRWTPITPLPLTVSYERPVTLGASVYLLIWEEETGSSTLMRYDTERDAWSTYPAPPGTSGELVATDSRLLVVSSTDEWGVVPDQAFDPETGTFTELPEDPLGPSFDRTAVWIGDRLLLGARDLVDNPGSGKPALVRLAELDSDLTSWRELGTTEILGSAARYASGRVVWPELGSADGGQVNNWGRHYDYGGIYDPDADSWTPLPTPPSGGPLPGTAIVASGLVEVGGHLLNPVTLEWTTVPALPAGERVGATTIGGDENVLVWGGGSYETPAPDGYLLWVKPLLPTPPTATPSAGTATPAPTPSESVEQPIQIEPGEQPTPIPPSADPSERGTSR